MYFWYTTTLYINYINTFPIIIIITTITLIIGTEYAEIKIQ
jgi:hypothetical protein